MEVTGAGGNVGMLTGAATGGSVTLYSGKGTMSSSGSFVIRTLDAGTAGLSGMLSLSSGAATSESSGSIMVGTGDALGGDGGMPHLTMGSGNSGKGGDAKVLAGAPGTARRAPAVV